MKPNHGHRQKSLTLPAVGRQLALYASYEPSPLPPLTVCSETEKSFVRRFKPSTTMFSITCEELRRLTPFYSPRFTEWQLAGPGPASSRQLEAVSLAECRVLAAECCSNQSPPTEIQPPQIRLQPPQTTIQPPQMIVQPPQMTLQPPQKPPRQPLTPMFSMNVLMQWVKKSICSLLRVFGEG